MATSLDLTNNLTTLDRAKEYLGETTGGSSHDSRIRAQIDQVSHLFNSKTGRKLKRRSITEYYDGDGSAELRLRQFPVRSATTDIEVYVVTGRSNFATDTDFSTDARVGSSDLNIRADAGLVRIKNRLFYQGVETVKVVYDAGYSSTKGSTASDAVPPDLEGAVLETVMFRWERQKQHRLGIQSITHDDGSATFTDAEMPMSAFRVINQYKSRAYGYG